MPWESSVNAEIYDRFVHRRSVYRWLNRVLVKLAGVADASRVLDLGCGTGATTLACLREMPEHATLVGVDSSAEMIEVARERATDRRARFEVLPARGVGALEGTFDRVVSNAAFWQFPSPGAVFEALARRTSPGARFVFNVPVERVEGQSPPIHPFQIALLKEIERELEAPFFLQATKLEPVGLAAIASGQGFTQVAVERHDYECVQEELIELMSIPAMIQPLMPGLDDERRRAVLARARERSDPELHVRVPWIYFVFERAGEASQ